MVLLNKLKKIIFLSLIICIVISKQINALENKIILKINNEIVTSVDLLNEINYLSMLNESFKNLSNEKIFEISKNSIITEKIKEIELSKYLESLEIDQEYFEILNNNFLKKTNFNSDEELKKYMELNNIEFNNIKKKMKIEFLWNQLILKKFSKDVKIDKKKN